MRLHVTTFSFKKFFDRHASYKSFLASRTFFLGCEVAERATKSQVVNSSFFTLNQETNTSMSPGWVTWTIFSVT